MHILNNKWLAYNVQLLRSSHWKCEDTNNCQIALYTYFVSCIRRFMLIVLPKTIWRRYLPFTFILLVLRGQC